MSHGNTHSIISSRVVCWLQSFHFMFSLPFLNYTLFFFDYDDDVSDKDDNKDRASALVLNGMPFDVEIKEK